MASDPTDLALGVERGDRRALGRAITLIESRRPDHRAMAEALLNSLLPLSGRSVRIGLSGPPGVGKSTLIEALGTLVTQRGHRIAVLAVDPSSVRTGGSILGDKTRMAELARNPQAFIRPSPAAGTLGGVARRTADVIPLVEAAGFDVVIVETVGVGQSEIAVADMVDLLILALPPAGGDELQGLKKGIVEMADLVVVNKADGELAASARQAVGEYQGALHLLRPANPAWTPPVLAVSAVTGAGLDALWQTIMQYRDTMEHAGAWQTRRADQASRRLWAEITETLIDGVRRNPRLGDLAPALERRVRDGEMSTSAAARMLVAALLGE